MAPPCKVRETLSILLVEDDSDHAVIVERTLEHGDIPCDITHAESGEQAMDWLISGKISPNLVLLDLKMPKVDGHEVLRLIKSHPDLRTIPVVILSTSDSEFDRAKAYKNNADCYQTKPIDVDTFKNMIVDLSTYWSEWNIPARNG